MKKPRIVVTGMGIVSCFGTEVHPFYTKLLEGQSGIVPIEDFPCADYPTRFAGCIRNFDPGEYLDKKQARRVDPFIRYAVVAGKKALEMGGLTGDAFTSLDLERCGVIIGSGMGGMTVLYEGVETILTKGFKRLSPFFVPHIITNMAGALLATDLGFMGPNYSISTACATANHSIYAAAEHIRKGDADLMLCGGTEAAINIIGLSGFVAMKALSTRNEEPEKASRPFDRDRDGFVMGEGSGVLLLESLDHALARGAKIYGEYLGGAVNDDAYHITDPRPDGKGVRLCMEKALLNAEVKKEQVSYINAHATSTFGGDPAELHAIKETFGDRSSILKVNATKSMTGHCLGAAGGIEAIVTLMAIETGKLHPNKNLDHPIPEAEGVGLVGKEVESHQIDVALSNSFGFGGHNSVLVLGRYKP